MKDIVFLDENNIKPRNSYYERNKNIILTSSF